MRDRIPTLTVWIALLSFCIGCRPPGKPTIDDVELRPAEIRNFGVLYQQNCAGCHGEDGKGNTALPLANPVYLAIVNDNTLRRVTTAGIHGTLMPAFARSAGGTLTDAQIEILVHGMRERWAKANEELGASPPPYRSGAPGNPQRGAAVYSYFCAACHGPDGKGTAKGSSIVDDSYLALVSDQDLRITLIAGRPDLGHPDWRSYVPGRAMTPEEITDVVAWLVSHRKANPGQPYALNDQPKNQN
jgi:cytochrome c oxidase cbb3-type subunit 3